RVEEFVHGDISFVDAINCNTGYFKLQNILDNSTTAAHEFGHTLGLLHPHNLDIRGAGTPGIMYPRGTLVDPPFQYYPEVAAGEKGGTLNPFTRRVLQKDIDDLHLADLPFNERGKAVIGEFSSVWHEKHLP
ncbi:MAG: peptidase M10, partial [Ferruginibacter sp.]